MQQCKISFFFLSLFHKKRNLAAADLLLHRLHNIRSSSRQDLETTNLEHKEDNRHSNMHFIKLFMTGE